MPSAALVEWTGPRAAMLDELHEVHATVGGTGPGRRWRTQQINWAIILRLAGEFQGFSRDLHTICADHFADWSSGTNPAAQRVVAASLTFNRQLDRGNAQPASLGSDFGRFGVDFWTALSIRNSLTASRQRHLQRLADARNAITHSRPAELQALAADGYPATMPTIRRWRRALTELASTMDEVMADHLATLFGRHRPW